MDALRTDFYKALPLLTRDQLLAVIREASHSYYNDGTSLLTDDEFDRVKDRYQSTFGPVSIGAPVLKEKVRLPYFMGSMDKIKPGDNLAAWARKYPGTVCISDKLDGISALYGKTDTKQYLYTRGDGTVGQDISHILPHILGLPLPSSSSTCVVRGELIVSKDNYERVKEGKKGARQMVCGLVNQKTLTSELRLVEFVAYEVISPSMRPIEQFQWLSSHGFRTARWQQGLTTLSMDAMSEMLVHHKASSPYEIDGLIVTHDAIYPRLNKNPEHAFAFKMAFADQQAITEVLGVRWEASKDGYLKPTVQFAPVHIGGTTIQYATGFNAAFVQSKGIGPGAFVEIIRSGDVIPFLRDVKTPATPAMPTDSWHWNETRVDAILDTVKGNPDVEKRALLYFAQSVGIGACGEGVIAKLYEAGIHTIPQLYNTDMNEAFVSKLPGFGAASAKKLLQNIEASRTATRTQWAVGSGIFGRGMGTKRLESALALENPTVSTVSQLAGWSTESATTYMKALPEFEAFVKRVGITFPLPSPALAPSSSSSPSSSLAPKMNETVLFTGFRSADLEAEVRVAGATLVDTFTKKVTILVVKDATVSNEKTKKALAAGIAVLTAEELRARLK